MSMDLWVSAQTLAGHLMESSSAVSKVKWPDVARDTLQNDLLVVCKGEDEEEEEERVSYREVHKVRHLLLCALHSTLSAPLHYCSMAVATFKWS